MTEDSPSLPILALIEKYGTNPSSFFSNDEVIKFYNIWSDFWVPGISVIVILVNTKTNKTYAWNLFEIFKELDAYIMTTTIKDNNINPSFLNAIAEKHGKMTHSMTMTRITTDITVAVFQFFMV